MNENAPRKAKQVICMRTDLNMRKGKMVSQGAHASLGVVWNIERAISANRDLREAGYDGETIPFIEAYYSWRDGTFTKICVGVNSEAELDEIANWADIVELPYYVITDSGATEFHGVPTKTCLAIGPAWADDIDKITGHLPLL